MAESQIAGLFMTPDMYRQQQAQADRMRAMEYAQLAPEQRAAMGFYSAGQGLGRVAGSLLGAQDPQLQRIAEQQRLLQGLDVADPDSLMQAARQASQAGNVPLAMQLAQQASQATQARDAAEQRRYQLAQLQAQEQQRRLTAAAQGVAAGAAEEIPTLYGAPAAQGTYMDDEGNVMPGAGSKLSVDIQRVAPQLIALGAPGMAALKQLMDFQKSMVEPTQVLKAGDILVTTQNGREVARGPEARTPEAKRSSFAQRLIEEGLEPNSPEFQQRMRQFNEAETAGKARGTGTTVVMPPSSKAENAYAAHVGKITADRDTSMIETAESVAATLPKMFETRQLLETGNLNTGILADYQQIISRSKAKFLNDKQAGRVVNDTEYLNALLGSDVFPQISALGIGARGLDTPAEREFLRQVITGTIQMDRETLKRMTNFRINAAERAVENFNKRLNAGEFRQYENITGRKLAPISVIKSPPGDNSVQDAARRELERRQRERR
jgi:hypothetical protein